MALIKKSNGKGKAFSIEFKPEQFKWCEDLIKGNVLIILGGIMDSFGMKVKPDISYKVGKHKGNNHVMVIPEDQLEGLDIK